MTNACSQSEVKIFNVTKQVLLAQNVTVARHFLSRMIGLLGKEKLLPSEGLLIPHCQAIHMFFMRFSIDVVFVSKENRVVGLVEKISPFWLSPIFFKSNYALELPAGTIARTKTAVGDYLQVEG